ncbi:ABC transporter permease [Micromonospora sp. NPDC047670]|uniref:ABC transporter permease n=1 Tax=Micromonospora sp. NPDC047670 TaxID=3364252 RepID=UPI00371BD383
MIGLALRMLRFHKGGFVACFIAMFLGATIVVGCGALLETGVRNAAPPERLAAAPIVVTADQRYLGTKRDLVFPERIHLDDDLADALAKIPGVARTVEDLSFEGTTASASVTGHGWSSAQLTPYRLAEGVAPDGPGQIVLGSRLAQRAGLRPGQPVDLMIKGGAQRFDIAGLATGAGDENTVFLADAEAERVGSIASIGVFTTAGSDTDQVARRLRDAVRGSAQPVAVMTGDERGRAENPAVIAEGADLIPLAAAFGGLSVMVTVFVVAGTLGLSMRRRQREMALLRAVGAAPGQVRRMILGETAMLAIVAAAPAWFAGPWLGAWLLRAFASADVVPDMIAFRSGPVPAIVGIGTALVAAFVAALIAVHRAAHTRPTEALAEVSLQRRWFSGVRTITGLLCLAGGAALAVGTAAADGPDAGSVATPAALVWTVGFGLLGPVLARAVTRSLRRPLRSLTGLAGHLATSNAQVGIARLAAAVMPVMLATGLATGLIYMQVTQSSGARQAAAETMTADFLVVSDAGGIPPGLLDTIRKEPAVAAATAQIPTRAYLEPATPPVAAAADEEESDSAQPSELSVRGVTPEGLTLTTAFRAATGTFDALHGDTVALPAKYAVGHELGDLIAMRLGDGTPVRLKLVATLQGRPGYETTLMPASLLLGHTTAESVPQIMVSAATGNDTAVLASRLADLAGHHPGVRVVDRAAFTAAVHDQDNTQASMAYLVLCVVVGYSVLALVNTQVLATGERRREFMLQRLVGTTHRQVLAMMTVEALLIAAVGLILGQLVAALTLMPLSLSVLGTLLPAGSIWILATVCGTATALTLATTLLATRFALRGRPQP